MATYVLVPGAWLGAWAWDDVAGRLRERGHEVYPVSLSGLGDRAHLGGPDVDLDTHIRDVVDVMSDNDLTEVVLVGHSYAGIVVTGAAARSPDRLARLVYVESAPVPDGVSMMDLYPPEARASMRRTVSERGEGWRLPFPSFDELAQAASLAGLGTVERTLMQANAVAQPFGTYTQPLRLGREDGDASYASYERVAVACDDLQRLIGSGEPSVQELKGPGWTYLELATGHWPMFSKPGELAELLDGLAP